jgi:hypothetical protein
MTLGLAPRQADLFCSTVACLRTSWHRWTILTLLAHAFLAVLAATQADDQNPDDDQLIPLTCNEIRRLFTGLCQQLPRTRTTVRGITAPRRISSGGVFKIRAEAR